MGNPVCFERSHQQPKCLVSGGHGDCFPFGKVETVCIPEDVPAGSGFYAESHPTLSRLVEGQNTAPYKPNVEEPKPANTKYSWCDLVMSGIRCFE